MCETPGCNRIPNPPHRRCCTLCGPSRGQHHRRRCNRQHSMLTDAWRSFDSRSRSPMAKAMPRQLRQAVDAPSAPTSQAVDAPSAPTSQAVDAPSAPTSTSIEPRQTPAAASDEILICKICHERLRCSGGATVTLSCGHLYCMGCWQRFLQTTEGVFGIGHYTDGTLRSFLADGMVLRCPYCRKPVLNTVYPFHG